MTDLLTLNTLHIYTFTVPPEVATSHSYPGFKMTGTPAPKLRKTWAVDKGRIPDNAEVITLLSLDTEDGGDDNSAIVILDSDDEAFDGFVDIEGEGDVEVDIDGMMGTSEKKDEDNLEADNYNEGADDEFAFDGDDADDGMAFDYDDNSNFNNPNAEVLGQAILDDHLHVASAVLADSSVTLTQVQNELRISIPVDELDQLARDACGLSFQPIEIAVLLVQSYRRGSPLPAVRVRQGEVTTSTQRCNKRFPVGLQLTQATRNYLAKHWDAARPDDFLATLCTLLHDRIHNAGNYCMMCDTELPFPGVKPTACNSQLCAYQLEGLGLGAGLSLFATNPKVADLLVSMASPACRDSARRAVAPVAMPPPGSDGHQITPGEFAALLDKVPKVETEFTEEGRAEALKEQDPRLESYLSWLFATAHCLAR